MTADAATQPAYDRAAPLQAVDSYVVEQTTDGLEITARLRVVTGQATTRGHFPRLAVLPGVFVIEAAGQALALAVDRAGGAPTVLRRLRSVRFLAPFLDGDELTLRLTTTPQPTGWLVRGEGVRADGVVAARLRAEFGAQEQAHA